MSEVRLSDYYSPWGRGSIMRFSVFINVVVAVGTETLVYHDDDEWVKNVDYKIMLFNLLHVMLHSKINIIRKLYFHMAWCICLKGTGQYW